MANSADREKINFNLDTAEREKSFEPFKAAMTGKDLDGNEEVRVITMTDPAEIPWQILADIDKPQQFLRHAVPLEDREWLARQKDIPGWKFGKLIEAYMTHFGVGNQGNAGGLLT